MSYQVSNATLLVRILKIELQGKISLYYIKKWLNQGRNIASELVKYIDGSGKRDKKAYFGAKIQKVV